MLKAKNGAVDVFRLSPVRSAAAGGAGQRNLPNGATDTG